MLCQATLAHFWPERFGRGRQPFTWRLALQFEVLQISTSPRKSEHL